MKLTTAAVAALALPSGRDDFTWWDDEIVGFGYRLRASGRAAWVFQYRLHRQSRRLTAKAAVVTPGAARAWAKQAASKVALGQDPSTKSEPEPETITVGEAVELFVDRQSQRLRPRSLIELKRHVGVHAAPLHRLPLVKVDRRAIAALLAKIGAASGPVAGNNVRRDLRAFPTQAYSDGYPAWMKKLRQSAGFISSVAMAQALQRPSSVRLASLRKMFLNLAKACSIGSRSGL